MGLIEWVRRTRKNIRSHGAEGIRDAADDLYGGLWRTVGWHVPRGTNIYEFDWDALVILDACRVDLMQEVQEKYSFINEVGSITSIGSMSQEWMAKTFCETYADEIARTAYVTANVFSDEELSKDDFEELDEVWRYGWDEEAGVVPPRPVTDRAISIAREHSPDRLIVHYMQPHHPFIGDETVRAAGVDADPFGKQGGETVVDALRKGQISRSEFWRCYRSNLEFVLEDVALLLSNLDAARVVLTADHGDALGEWGIYDHPAGCLHPAVAEVPWIETSATDTGDYEPDLRRDNGREASVTDRLRSLGYV